MPRLGSIFAAIGAGSKSLQSDNARQKAEQASLEDRLARQAEVERRHTLEDMVFKQSQEDRARRIDRESRTAPLLDKKLSLEVDRMKQPPKQSAPVPGTPEYYTMREKEAQIAASHRASTARPKQLPSNAVEKEIGVDNMLSTAADVQQRLGRAVKSKTNASGRLFGVVRTPTWAKNAVGMGGVEGESTRTAIGSLKATIAKERAGTSMTPGELDLLESYVPNDNDDETTALRKANQFVRALQQIKANRAKAYSRYGYAADGVPGPEDDDIEAGLPHP